MHMSMSFAPDGTDVGGSPSVMFQTMAADGISSVANWETQIVRAVQTWVANTNISVGIVSDSGDAFGSAGAVQGDTRFGDIRIAARPLSSGAVAESSPFTWNGSTWAGDIVFNSNYKFGIGNSKQFYDVFSVALHEVGHVLGIDDNSVNPSAAMYQSYHYLTGLDSTDIASVQSIYGGARAPDQYDAASPNNSLASAAPIGLAVSNLVVGDITTSGDVDYYSFTSPTLLGLTGFTVNLQTSGISLLASRLNVYNSSGRLVGSAVSTDPFNGDLTVTVSSLLPNLTYYVGVSGSRSDVFGIGRYQLSASFQILGVSVTGTLKSVGQFVTSLAASDNNTNDTLGTATILAPLFGNSANSSFDYCYKGSITSSDGTDWYKVQSPSAGAAPLTMAVMLWEMDGTNFQGRVAVCDAAGNPVAFQVLNNGSGQFSVQITNATPDSAYYIKVTAANPGAANATGDYYLAVDFNQAPPQAVQNIANGTLSKSAPTTSGTFSLNVPALTNFSLAASGPASSYVVMTVTDKKVNVVLSLTAFSGQLPQTAIVYLGAGNYQISYQTFVSTGTMTGPVSFSLFGVIMNDPVGPYQPAPSGSTSPSSSPSSNSAPPPDYTYSPADANGTSTSSSYPYYY
jgi:hypothetical protein